MVKNREDNGTEVIGLVTPTPAVLPGDAWPSVEDKRIDRTLYRTPYHQGTYPI